MTQSEIKETKKIASAPEAKKDNLEQKRQRDREKVRGKFHFHEVPGGTLSFSVLLDKGDKVVDYSLNDGEIHTVPRNVARHLNTNVAYPNYGHVAGDEMMTGLPAALYGASGAHMKITQMVRRCSFQSLEFLDIDEEEVKS